MKTVGYLSFGRPYRRTFRFICHISSVIAFALTESKNKQFLTYLRETICRRFARISNFIGFGKKFPYVQQLGRGQYSSPGGQESQEEA